MKKILTILFLLSFFSCKKNEEVLQVTVKNTQSFSRTELVSIPVGQFKLTGKSLEVFDVTADTVVPHQWIDSNLDKQYDEFIFQATLEQNEEKKFVIRVASLEQMDSTIDHRTYARFVPERIDDMAWENDRVAFRTYGPEAQRLVDANEKGGTLSSGMDCWLKRVDYPVINRWYKKYTEGGTYHKDDGEGYDPYHVGASRGCGGIGVLEGDSLFVSKNFVTHKVITKGPLRSILELTYAPWIANGIEIKEKKIITIDVANQLYRIDEVLETSKPLSNVTIGLTLHEKKGEVKRDSASGWFRYWEPIDSAMIGTAVVIDPKLVTRSMDFRTTKKDLSHLYIVTNPNQSLAYFTGFAWSKAGIIQDSAAWDNYLSEFTKRLSTPVEVEIYAK